MAMMEEMMMEEQAPRPAMPSMEGANMPPEAMMAPSADMIPPEAMQRMMQSDDAIQAVLMVRLNQMTKEELEALDAAITPDVAAVLVKLLPEFREIIEAMASGQAAEAMASVEEPSMPAPRQEPDMGALGNL